MLETILLYVQPLTVIVFVVSGACCLGLGLLQQGCINLTLAVVNTLIFYGDKVFK